MRWSLFLLIGLSGCSMGRHSFQHAHGLFDTLCHTCETHVRVPTGLPHLGVQVLLGDPPGILPPKKMDPRIGTGVGLVPTLKFKF